MNKTHAADKTQVEDAHQGYDPASAEDELVLTTKESDEIDGHLSRSIWIRVLVLILLIGA